VMHGHVTLLTATSISSELWSAKLNVAVQLYDGISIPLVDGATSTCIIRVISGGYEGYAYPHFLKCGGIVPPTFNRYKRPSCELKLRRKVDYERLGLRPGLRWGS